MDPFKPTLNPCDMTLPLLIFDSFLIFCFNKERIKACTIPKHDFYFKEQTNSATTKILFPRSQAPTLALLLILQIFRKYIRSTCGVTATKEGYSKEGGVFSCIQLKKSLIPPAG